METTSTTIGGGCFWCLEAIFRRTPGVSSVVSGYAGGRTPNPTYKEICTGNTGHAEVIQIQYHPETISFQDILSVFWQAHDPTTLNRQGNDIGTQYRSGIYTFFDEQKELGEASRRMFQEKLSTRGFDPITTEVISAPNFYYAEHYHQQYLAKVPNGYCGLGGTGVCYRD